jgi:cell wall-associated NlpC family hydrolase
MRTLICSISVLFLCVACSSAPPRYARGGTGNRDVVSLAKHLIGTPYHYGGASPRTGFDCSGLVHYVYYRTRGVSLPHSTRLLSRSGRPVRYANLRPGDLVFFNTLHRPYSHVGIYIGNHRFIHSPHSGETVETADMDINYWREHYNGARRVTKQYR